MDKIKSAVYRSHKTFPRYQLQPVDSSAMVDKQMIMRSILLLLLSGTLLIVPADSLTDPSVPYIFFPFGEDEGDRPVVGDDVSSPAVNIPGGFPFLFGNYTSVYVSIKVYFLDFYRAMHFSAFARS